MEFNINSFPDFVSNAMILWAKAYDSVPQVARTSGLFKEIPVPQLTGNSRTFSEIDLEEYASGKGESDQAKRAKIAQGYKKTLYLKRYGKDIGISYEARTQGKYEEIKTRITNLGKLVPNRLDLDLTHKFTFGTATSMTNMDGETVDLTCGDTLQLFHTAHTINGSSTTFRNRLANNPQFSRGALESMELMRLQNKYNQHGEIMTFADDILWSSIDPNTVYTISETMRATSRPDQNNPNVPNVITKYRHVALPRLATDANGGIDTTKLKYWGVASSEMSTAYLGVHEEARLKTPPAEGKSNEEFSTDDWNFGTRGGYLHGVVSASWVGFSSGDGEA